MKTSKTNLDALLEAQLKKAAKHVLNEHPKLGDIPLTTWQAAAAAAGLPKIEKADNPIALAIHSTALDILDARKKRKPTAELDGWRRRFFEDARKVVCSFA
jgi:hypothetical protein